MAKVYGGRYELTGRSIGGGAQGDVFRVKDLQSLTREEYALKRLKKADRDARFKAEIDALLRVQHPRIVPILDHAGRRGVADPEGKQWFVMPIANGNLEEHLGLYTGNIEAVLRVAMQLCEALEASHHVGIIHRDVKPGNILFPRLDHDVWLSDFGICHSGAGKDRLTEVGEVVGPRGFTAPELEVGGHVPVTPSVDLYSIGKVVYYMLSGGRKVAREQLGSDEYRSVFANGERFGLLRNLLARLITTVDRRISSAAEVRQEFERIRDWENAATRLSLEPGVLAKIAQAQEIALAQNEVRSHNNQLRADREAQIRDTTSAVQAWLLAELKKIAPVLQGGGAFRAEVDEATWVDDQHFGAALRQSETFIGEKGAQISLINEHGPFSDTCILKIFVCVKRRWQIVMAGQEKREAPIDTEMALIPYVALLRKAETRHSMSGQLPWMGGFVRDKDEMTRVRTEAAQRLGRHHGISSSEPQIAATFVGIPYNVAMAFRISEWPAAATRAQGIISRSVEAFIEFATKPSRSVGA